MKLTHKNKSIKASSNKSANTLYDDIREEIWQFTSTLLRKEYEQYGITEEAPNIEGYLDIEEAEDALTKALIDYLDIQIEYGVKIKASTKSRRKAVKASKYNDSDYTVMYEIYIDDKASDLEFDTEDEAYDYAVTKVAKDNPTSSIKIYKNFYDYNGESQELSFVDAEWCDTVTASTRSRRRSIKASNNIQSQFDVRTQFQSFLTKVDREVSNALYQYDDAIWNVKGTMSVDSEGYWFELNLWCDREEAGTVNITVDTNSNYRTATDAYVVTVPDTDEIQAEGNSFDDVYETCVGELLRLAEDYVNFVRDDRY